MGRVYRAWYTKPDGKGGRVRVQVKNYTAEYRDAGGKKCRRTIGPDRRLAESALARLQESAHRARLGIPDPAARTAAGTTPLSDLRREYLELLACGDTCPAYRATTKTYLTKMSTACGWQTFADVTADSLLKFLGSLRKPTKRYPAGRGPATLNGYLRTAKAFANWCADRFDAASPLRKLKPFAEEVDRRRSKRILTDAELHALLEAARRAPRRLNAAVPGRDRAYLYLVAAYSGLRASELATLTPGHFALDATPPTVTVPARDSKGKREEPVPLPAHVAAELRPWLAGKPPGKRLWPGKWAEHRHQAEWILADARRAKIADADAPGRKVCFHGLKRRYVTRLLETGADIDKVRRLARHKDVATTLNYYAASSLADLAAAADRLPVLGAPLAPPVRRDDTERDKWRDSVQ